MDFLDPRKRRHHKIRLMIGYGLMSVALVLTSLVLLYGVSGYGLNTKTGDVIQNSLLFVDSKPGGATIFINDQDNHSKTSSRLVLQTGHYSLTLKKEGYREWQKELTLNERLVAHYVYPFLFPSQPQAKNLKVYPLKPQFITASPDRRWLLVQTPAGEPGSVSFDQFETGKLDQPPKSIKTPAGLLTNFAKPNGSLKAIEWASDNNQILMQYSFDGGREFIIFNRSEPAKSTNVNKLINNNPTQVALAGNKADQLLVFNQPEAILSVADISKKSFTPLLSHVLAFNAYRPELFSYVTNQEALAGQVVARIWNKGKSYPLYTFAAGNNYFLEASEFQGHWYYVAGSDLGNRINVFKDPLDTLKDPKYKASALLSLTATGATSLSFSENARYIELQSGQKFSVYDIETANRHQFNLEKPIAGQFLWMDGYHLIGQSNGSILVMDYDGLNQQLLTPSIYPQGGYFDKDYNQLFTVTLAADGTSYNLHAIDMRAGEDLPRP